MGGLVRAGLTKDLRTVWSGLAEPPVDSLTMVGRATVRQTGFGVCEDGDSVYCFYP